MQTYNSLLSQETRRLIDLQIFNLTASIAAGALGSYEEYKYYAGKIAGLRDAADLLDEAVAILDGKKRSD
jgi:hypothetical protein